MQAISRQIGLLAAPVLQADRIDPRTLSGDQLLSLSQALHSLEVYEDCGAALQEAQQSHLKGLHEVFQDKLDLLTQLPAGNGGPKAVLRALDEIQDAAKSLAQAAAAFSSGDDADPDSVQSELIQDRFRKLPPQARSNLAAAFAHPQFAALTAALRTGEALALELHDTLLADRFAGMARSGQLLIGGTASSSSARLLSDDARSALHEDLWTDASAGRVADPAVRRGGSTHARRK